MPQTGIVPHKRPLPADPISYSREELFSLQPHKCALDVKAHFRQLKCYGLLRYRGPRINNRGRNNTQIRPIPTTVNYRADCCQHNGSHIAENLRETQRSVNFVVLRSVKKLRQPKVYGIPTILSTNVRSLPKKVEEIQQIAELNSAGAICITESWLSTDIPDSCIAIPGFNLFRKDRIYATGGGVCIYLDQKIPCELLQSCDQEEVESLWISIRPHSLPRQITSIVLGIIYHSTSNREPENVILRDHIQKNLDVLLLKQPNALVVLTGDFNPTSTGFQAQYIARVNPLKQLVSFKTRDTGTLDWFFTNRSKLFTLSQLPKVGFSDHSTILAKPVSAPITTHTTEKSVVRDMRDSARRAFGRWITQKGWTPILNASSCEQKFQLLM